MGNEPNYLLYIPVSPRRRASLAALSRWISALSASRSNALRPLMPLGSWAFATKASSSVTVMRMFLPFSVVRTVIGIDSN